MILQRILRAILGLSFCLMLTSCGGATDESSDLIDLDVTAGGLILPTDNPTCVDKATDPTIRSAKAPTLNFGALRINWKPTDKSLYIGLVRITVTSSNILGGSYTVALPSDEIAILLGASASTIQPDTVNGNKVIASNSSKNRDGFINCGLTVGGVAYAAGAEGKQFVASVRVEIVGQAQDSKGNLQVVRKSYSTTATAY